MMLTELDTAIGDGDHGENMRRGFTAVTKKLENAAPPEDMGALFKLVGMTLLSSVGVRPDLSMAASSWN